MTTTQITQGDLQEARDNLLELRYLLSNTTLTPDWILRYLDEAIRLIPGEGKPIGRRTRNA